MNQFSETSNGNLELGKWVGEGNSHQSEIDSILDRRKLAYTQLNVHREH